MLNTDTFFERDARKGAVIPKERQLSPVEVKIAGYIAEGLSNKQIADKVGKTWRSVEYHKRSLMLRFDAVNSPNLISILYQQNILKCSQ